MDNISSHGEMSIAIAQKGKRQSDSHHRVGVTLWLVIGTIVFMYSMSQFEVFPTLLFLGLQVLNLLIAATATVLLGRSNRRKWEAQDAEERRMKAAEKDRQMAEFLKASEEK